MCYACVGKENIRNTQLPHLFFVHAPFNSITLSVRVEETLNSITVASMYYAYKNRKKKWGKPWDNATVNTIQCELEMTFRGMKHTKNLKFGLHNMRVFVCNMNARAYSSFCTAFFCLQLKEEFLHSTALNYYFLFYGTWWTKEDIRYIELPSYKVE